MNIIEPIDKFINCPVIVKWQDSACRPGWSTIDKTGPANITTCGILVNYTEDYIVVALGISSSGAVHDQITIPIGCIDSVGKLGEQVF